MFRYQYRYIIIERYRGAEGGRGENAAVLRSRHFFGRLRLRKSRGNGAGSDQIGSAPAPGKKRRIQAAPAPYTKIL